jgi:4-diphosphocytidyl-2-C-methyl-D-erythritol kinase
VTLVARAPGKVNLCLFLGPVRSDGRHALVTLFESVSLADEVTVAPWTAPAPGSAPNDQIVCPGVDGVNIVAQTLDGLRARGWAGPPVRVTIEKRIPVAGGMGGGSADAAAMLRLAARLAPVPAMVVAELAVALGADVPSQLEPGLALGTGAGEVVEFGLALLAPHAFVIVPQEFGLSTPEVYREADRLGLPRDVPDLCARERDLRAALRSGKDLPADLLVNDLEPAAISLCPEIGVALSAVRAAGAEHAMVSGSGPTVFGLLTGSDAAARAETAAEGVADRYPGATAAAPVSEEFGAPRGT